MSCSPSYNQKISKDAPTVRPCAIEDFVGEGQHFDFLTALSLAKKNVNVAVTGVTGAGKSTLINTLCGVVLEEKNERPAKEGDDLSLETREVASCVAQKASLSDKVYTITVWDSPGLEDGTGKGVAYIQQLRKQSDGHIDILLYCVDASQSRCVADDMVPGMAVVTRTLGAEVWQHAVVVLTFANLLDKNIKEDAEKGEDTDLTFASRINRWEEKVRSALMKAGVADKTAREIPVEPAGFYDSSPSLPGRDHWLGCLWFQFLVCARDEARLAILINSQHRIRDAEHVTPEELRQQQRDGKREIPIVIDQQLVSRVGAGVDVRREREHVGKGMKIGVGGPLVGFAVNKMMQYCNNSDTPPMYPRHL